MNVSIVLVRARDSLMKELTLNPARMHLGAYVIHVLRAAGNDTELANKALAYLPTHQERFDQAIELARKEEEEAK